jgi:hypothetical protein
MDNEDLKYCSNCRTHGLKIGYLGLETCELCDYTNMDENNKKTTTTHTQKIARFTNLLRSLSIESKTNTFELINFLVPYFDKLNIKNPSSVLIKQVLTMYDFILPCESQSFVKVIRCLEYFRNEKLNLSQTNKKIIIELFKQYLNYCSKTSMNDKFQLSYASCLAIIYQFVTGSNLLNVSFLTKYVDDSLQNWLKSEAIQYIEINRNLQETRKLIRFTKKTPKRNFVIKRI